MIANQPGVPTSVLNFRSTITSENFKVSVIWRTPPGSPDSDFCRTRLFPFQIQIHIVNDNTGFDFDNCRFLPTALDWDLLVAQDFDPGLTSPRRIHARRWNTHRRFGRVHRFCCCWISSISISICEICPFKSNIVSPSGRGSSGCVLPVWFSRS